MMLRITLTTKKPTTPREDLTSSTNSAIGTVSATLSVVGKTANWIALIVASEEFRSTSDNTATGSRRTLNQRSSRSSEPSHTALMLSSDGTGTSIVCPPAQP